MLNHLPLHGRISHLAHFVAVLLFLLGAASSFGQSSSPAASSKTAVAFSCTCTDEVGQLYASALRDQIARSPRYRLAESAEAGTKEHPIFHLNIEVVSIDDSFSNSGQKAAMSVVFLMGNSMYIGSDVQTCGIDKVDLCVRETLAELDSDMH